MKRHAEEDHAPPDQRPERDDLPSHHKVELLVRKFREVWRRGYSAHLHLECKDGEAWANLRGYYREEEASSQERVSLRKDLSLIHI